MTFFLKFDCLYCNNDWQTRRWSIKDSPQDGDAHNLSLSGGNKINARYMMIMESFDKAHSADHIFGPTAIFLWEPEEVGIRPVRLVTLSLSFFVGSLFLLLK